MTLAPVPRPVGVTTVAVIAFVQSSFGILGGLALIIEQNDRELIAHVGQSSGRITTYGVAAIIWGVVIFFAALGLWNGANWARILVGILEVTSPPDCIYSSLGAARTSGTASGRSPSPSSSCTSSSDREATSSSRAARPEFGAARRARGQVALALPRSVRGQRLPSSNRSGQPNSNRVAFSG
jgi:hypothetical protein